MDNWYKDGDREMSDLVEEQAWAERERLDDMADIVIHDGRRCPHHPHVIISSPDGMFDGLCDLCEGAMYEHMAREAAELAEAERHAREGSPCTVVVGCKPFHWSHVPCAECNEDEIPF